LILTHDKNRAEVDRVIAQAKKELRSLFVKSEDQIKKVGNALKKVVKKEESICEEIKIALKEEIAEGVISTRTIELHCPPEWKHKTKPKQRENEKISFSKPQQQQIAATQEGKSAIVSDRETTNSDSVSQPYASAQNGIGVTDKNEIQTTATNQGKLSDYKETKETSTIDNFTPTHTVEKLSSHPSDKQESSHLFEFTIPKEKYEMVRDAMNKSKNAIFVKLDGNNKFLSADADVFDNSDDNHQIQFQSKDHAQAVSGIKVRNVEN